MTDTDPPTPRPPPIPPAMREKHEAIAGLIDDFCRRHLTEEYRVYCQRMATLLARKSPSPMAKGDAASWACGIVRAVGWVNYLDDKETTPHMRSADVNKHFGVTDATAHNRSKKIRDLLGIGVCDAHWTLPSMMDQNPIAWLVRVNGIPADARNLPRELQIEAFEQGLIPYLPPERAALYDQN